MADDRIDKIEKFITRVLSYDPKTGKSKGELRVEADRKKKTAEKEK